VARIPAAVESRGRTVPIDEAKSTPAKTDLIESIILEEALVRALGPRLIIAGAPRGERGAPTPSERPNFGPLLNGLHRLLPLGASALQTVFFARAVPPLAKAVWVLFCPLRFHGPRGLCRAPLRGDAALEARAETPEFFLCIEGDSPKGR